MISAGGSINIHVDLHDGGGWSVLLLAGIIAFAFGALTKLNHLNLPSLRSHHPPSAKPWTDVAAQVRKRK
ncbi:hypothetical protein K402DRAFT_392483 [Aulographum hederae CBS 113979]|uniref:Uncharacterized protein n=1 Tax=Aulographum hederae CBS 113979 TaxID=1176131 RepID=A0A6G1H372_9PEZI|nr:hypothetical protein K402DRAFT_392483 [Aulographum hederae CBS 113979]